MDFTEQEMAAVRKRLGEEAIARIKATVDERVRRILAEEPEPVPEYILALRKMDELADQHKRERAAREQVARPDPRDDVLLMSSRELEERLAEFEDE